MLSDDDVRALAMAVPFRHRWRHWRLLYSTARDGISLQTLYRQNAELQCRISPIMTMYPLQVPQSDQMVYLQITYVRSDLGPHLLCTTADFLT